MRERLDNRCLALIGYITIAQREKGWVWFRQLCKNSRMPFKTVRDHLRHLKEQGIVEYEKKRSPRGAKRLFRISSDHLWRERMELQWCQKIHDLVREALTYLGSGSLEEQLCMYDLGYSDLTRSGRPRLPVTGMMLLGYRAQKQIIEEQNAPPRSNNLLVIEWSQIQRRRVEFKVRVLQNQEMPSL